MEWTVLCGEWAGLCRESDFALSTLAVDGWGVSCGRTDTAVRVDVQTVCREMDHGPGGSQRRPIPSPLLSASSSGSTNTSTP